ncbi:MAG: hypothetical protein K2Q12_01335 [Rickettsiales bacterium]|nr:hypothetical protein [Rickettsiales bacterium]
MSVMLLIADTIQKADKSYLFEDYTKQALAVVQALKAEGYIVVPRKATEAMLEAGEKSILAGKTHPKDHVRWVYDAMVSCGERERPE